MKQLSSMCEMYVEVRLTLSELQSLDQALQLAIAKCEVSHVPDEDRDYMQAKFEMIRLQIEYVMRDIAQHSRH